MGVNNISQKTFDIEISTLNLTRDSARTLTFLEVCTDRTSPAIDCFLSYQFSNKHSSCSVLSAVCSVLCLELDRSASWAIIDYRIKLDSIFSIDLDAFFDIL